MERKGEDEGREGEKGKGGKKKKKEKEKKKKEREGEREDNIINPRVSLSSQDSNPDCGFRLLLISSSEKEQ